MDRYIKVEHESYMFSCNNFNVVIDSADKVEAIKKFKKEFENLFCKDWQVFKINTNININNEVRKYI